MAVFRVEKNHNYTVMSNYHLRDTGLTLKAIGLLSKMLSLTDEWDYRNIRKNSGSRTAGVDNKTISDLNKWNENALVAHVQRKLDWYIPNAVRRVEIPKDNGKTRPLGIPTIMDRLIQQCILQVVSAVVHILIHSSNECTIRKYLKVLNLDKKQLAKLNKLRVMAEMQELVF